MVDPATIDQQFEQIVCNTALPAPPQSAPLIPEVAARLLVLLSFTIAVIRFNVPSPIVALVAVALVALAAGEAVVDRRSVLVIDPVSVHA